MLNKTVLLVDDELDLLNIMETKIKGWGYDVVTAQSGKEALAIIEDHKPDVVILDYKLPDMDGVAVLTEIRKASINLPVIMFTAYPEMQTIKEVKALGVSAFIPKLSSYVDVQAALKTALDMVHKNS